MTLEIAGNMKFWLRNFTCRELHYPICLKGNRVCPPENCGGVRHHSDFLEAIGDVNHPEHDDMLEWIGDEFNPKEFDIESIDEQLKHIK